MDQSFCMLLHRNDDRLHVKLTGRFDENSAHKLVGLLGSYADKFSTVFIHTAGLHAADASSLEACRHVLQRLRWKSTRLVATGSHAHKLVPDAASIRCHGDLPQFSAHAARG